MKQNKNDNESIDNLESEIESQKDVIKKSKLRKKFLKKRKQIVNTHDYFYPLLAAESSDLGYTQFGKIQIESILQVQDHDNLNSPNYLYIFEGDEYYIEPNSNNPAFTVTTTVIQDVDQFVILNPRLTDFDFQVDGRTETAKSVNQDSILEIEAIERFPSHKAKHSTKNKHVSYEADRKKNMPVNDVKDGSVTSDEQIRLEYESSLGPLMLDIKDLTKDYGKTKVLKGINLQVFEGERVSLVGPNGAGKSTLSEIISKVKEPTSGYIDYSFGKSKSEISSKIGIQFQESDYPFYYRVIDIVKFFSEATKTNLTKEQISELLKGFQLFGMEKKRAIDLSGGQRQRLNVLLAVLNAPKLLILDELSNGLDVEARASIKLFIRDYLEQHHSTLFMVSHNPDEIEFLAKRMIILYDGLIYKDLMVADIKRDWGSVEKYLDHVFLVEFHPDSVNKQHIDTANDVKKDVKNDVKNVKNEEGKNNFLKGGSYDEPKDQPLEDFEPQEEDSRKERI